MLVDTSVWVSHFKQANPQLVDLLEAGVVLCHPHVVVEIACGTPYGLQCVAAHCLQGYETIEWRDLGGSCTYRCKPQ